MVDQAQILRFSDSVVLDGSGNGTIRVAPRGQKWEVESTRVYATSNTLEAQCLTYRDSVANINQVEGTYSGSSGDTSDTKFYLPDGQALYFVWVGGDPGATAFVSLTGWASLDQGSGFRARVH